MESETNNDWEQSYDFVRTETIECGDDTITLQHDHDASRYTVIARVRSEVYCKEFDEEIDANRYVRSMKQLADNEIEYLPGDEVFGIDQHFEPVVQRGIVGLNMVDDWDSIAVEFTDDPFDAESDEVRVIDMQPEQLIHVDAGAVEVLSRLGLTDLLEARDFDA